MKSHSNAGTSVLKKHYEKKVHELEQEKRVLQVSVTVSVVYILI